MSALQPFSRSPETEGLALRAQWDRTLDRSLVFRFRLDGPLGGLHLPEPLATPTFREKLWEDTCFEVFLGIPGQEMYWEWNFSPSGDWALFEFTEPRRRAALPPMPQTPDVSVRSYGPALTLEAAVDVNFSPTLAWALQTRSPIEASMTAVLKHERGTYSYWALKHAGEKPDFHRRESFILRV